jgi:hypothetical protein
MRTYRTCNPRSSQTGFQSARPSPASTLLQTSTIIVVAVSMSKQHWALLYQFWFTSCSLSFIPSSSPHNVKSRCRQVKWTKMWRRKTHLNPSSKVINHCLLSVPSTQHPAMIAGQVRLSSALFSLLSPRREPETTTYSIDIPSKAVEVEQCVRTCRAASWTLASSLLYPNTILNNKI